MKTFLIFFMVLGANLILAFDEDTTFDSNYRLYDVQPEEMVDTSVRLIVVEEKNVHKRSNDWINGPVNQGPYGEGSNYDSIHNINPKVAGFISVCFLSFVLYIIFRVRRSMKKDKRNQRH